MGSKTCVLDLASVLVINNVVTCSCGTFSVDESSFDILGSSRHHGISVTNSKATIRLNALELYIAPAIIIDNSTVTLVIKGTNVLITENSIPLVSCIGGSSISFVSDDFSSLSLESKSGPGIGTINGGFCQSIDFSGTKITMNVPTNQPSIDGRINDLTIQNGHLQLDGTGIGQEVKNLAIGNAVELECSFRTCVRPQSIRFSGLSSMKHGARDLKSIDLYIQYTVESQSESLNFPALHFGKIDGLTPPGLYDISVWKDDEIQKTFVYDSQKIGFLVSLDPGSYRVGFVSQSNPINTGFLSNGADQFMISNQEVFVKNVYVRRGMDYDESLEEENATESYSRTRTGSEPGDDNSLTGVEPGDDNTPTGSPDNSQTSKIPMLVGIVAGVAILLVVIIIVCICKRQEPSSSGSSSSGSLLDGYSE